MRLQRSQIQTPCDSCAHCCCGNSNEEKRLYWTLTTCANQIQSCIADHHNKSANTNMFVS